MSDFNEQLDNAFTPELLGAMMSLAQTGREIGDVSDLSITDKRSFLVGVMFAAANTLGMPPDLIGAFIMHPVVQAMLDGSVAEDGSL